MISCNQKLKELEEKLDKTIHHLHYAKERIVNVRTGRSYPFTAEDVERNAARIIELSELLILALESGNESKI